MSKKISWIIGITAVVALIAALAVSKTELYKGFLPGIKKQPIQLQPATAFLNYNRLAFSPFNGEVIHISYQLSISLGKHEVIIYNSRGQVVRKLSSFNYSTKPRAIYVDLWDGRDDQGNLVTPGVYTYSIEGYELVPARPGQSNAGQKLQPVQGVIEVLTTLPDRLSVPPMPPYTPPAQPQQPTPFLQ